MNDEKPSNLDNLASATGKKALEALLSHAIKISYFSIT
jgi:hypothetical protein